MRPSPIEIAEESNKIVASIYQICVFGNGTINEFDKKLVKARLIPSYIQAKWIRFNKFGLNKTKIENSLIMFFAHTTTITLDVLVLPIAFSAGQAQIQIIPIIVNTTKLILSPIPKLFIQEYFERKFNEEMFSQKDPKFLKETKATEEFILQKHNIDFTLPAGYLEILKKFTEIPMLNFIFFYAQMTEEFIIYRKKYIKKEDLCFKNLNQATEYFKITFRMMRFFYHSEIHALNYFFNHAFQNILNFYLNINSLREKYISIFYTDKKKAPLLLDVHFLLSHLNFKIQTSRSKFLISSEICEEAQFQFQHFYFSFFSHTSFDYKEIAKFTESPEIKSMLNLSHNDSVKLKDILSNLSNSYIQAPLKQNVTSNVLEKGEDFLCLILNILTGITSPDRSKQIAGSLTIIGVSMAIGGLIAAAAIGIKNHKRLMPFINAINMATNPIQAFFQNQEKRINEWFKTDSIFINSGTNRVLGSVLFIASHIPAFTCLKGMIPLLNHFSPFHPLNDFILRSAEDFTKKRLETIDMAALHRVDRSARLGYTENGELVVKIYTTDGHWMDNFNMNLIQEDFLHFITNDFARVVRHESQNMGILFEKIAQLDKEIEAFDKISPHDFLYTHRDAKGPVYFQPICRITTPITQEALIQKAKQKFFDILIERQTLLIMLINRSYYVTLYNLFMNKMKDRCNVIFKEHLPIAMDMFERLLHPLDTEMMSIC